MWAPAALALSASAFVIARTVSPATTPQMGWNSWNKFKNDFNQTTIEQTANLMVELGLRDAGYEYLIVDAGWQDWTRGKDGRQRANASRFPDGVAGMANMAHKRGLKFGIYSDAGFYDCMYYPGSWGYEELDAQSYADWGVDYLKYDNCGGFQANINSPLVRFGAMGDALVKTGKDIFYSLCQWGDQFPWYWADQIAQSYRMSGDIWASFAEDLPGCNCRTAYCLATGYGGCSVLTIMGKMRELSLFQKRGSWADMDMLEIGNANMTEPEERTHMAFWAALKSPLIIGADLTIIPKSSLEILKHPGILALSKDPLGEAPIFLPSASENGRLQIWAGRLQQGFVVLVFNEAPFARDIEIPYSALWEVVRKSSKFRVKEVWTNQDKGVVENVVKLNMVEAHDTAVLVLEEVTARMMVLQWLF